MSETASMLAIRGEFTIFTAQDIKARLITAIDAAQAVIDVDLVDVSDIDTAGIQLMLLAKREAAAAGKHVRFIRHSDAVLDLMDLYDLAGQFGDPILIQPLP